MRLHMVLKPSDYSLPEPGESLDPTSPTDFITRLAGMAFSIGAVVFVYRLASGKVAGTMNDVFGSVSGGVLSSGDSGGPWGDL